jgi:SAM-dependent methyltransferase
MGAGAAEAMMSEAGERVRTESIPVRMHAGELTDPELIGSHNYWMRTDWTNRGEERSEAWGGSDGLWLSMLYPRLQAFLPAATVLEIGCGAGRVTHYLRQWAKRTIAVDLAERPAQLCRQRFGADVECIVNDGRSLGMIEASTVNLCVSFEALVWSDIGTIRAYLEGLARVLVPGGVALLHHSNLGQYGAALPEDPTGRLLGGRKASVSAELVREMCAAVGLRCRSQELFSCSDSPTLTDALSLIEHDGSGGGAKTVVEERWDWALLQREAKRCREMYRGSRSVA